MGWLAENQSQGGVFWWLEALTCGEAAGAIPVQSVENLGKSLQPCAVSPSGAVFGWVPGPLAAQPCFESPCPKSFSRGVSVVRYQHQILLIKIFKYVFLKEAFSLIFHGEGHTSVCPKGLRCEMFCPCKSKYNLRWSQKGKCFSCFWEEFSLQGKCLSCAWLAGTFSLTLFFGVDCLLKMCRKHYLQCLCL